MERLSPSLQKLHDRGIEADRDRTGNLEHEAGTCR